MWQLLLKVAQNKSLHKYLIVGVTAFATEYLTFLLLYKALSVQVYVANSLSFCCGLLVSFFLNRRWTFKTTAFKLRGHHQFAIYSTLALFNLLMTNVIIGVLKHQGLTPLVGKVVAMMAIVVWNFIIFRLVIFRSHETD